MRTLGWFIFRSYCQKEIKKKKTTKKHWGMVSAGTKQPWMFNCQLSHQPNPGQGSEPCRMRMGNRKLQTVKRSLIWLLSDQDTCKCLQTAQFPETWRRMCLERNKHKLRQKCVGWNDSCCLYFLTLPDGRAPYQHFTHPSQPLLPVPGPCMRVIRPAQQVIPNYSNPRAPKGTGDRPPQRTCSSPGPPRFP